MKQGEYLPILHEAPCDNYFIVKCLLQSIVARVILFTLFTYLLHPACLTSFDANLVQTSRSEDCKFWLYVVIFLFAYFSSNILYSVHFILYSMVFCNRFAFKCFVPNIRLVLSCWFHCVDYFISNLDSVKFSQ